MGNVYSPSSKYIERRGNGCIRRMILNFQTGSGMEEAMQPPNPQNLPPSKKRPLDSNALQSSRYFKMRTVLKDLRPHFLEVLRTPEFRNCKAAHEIQDQMKFLMVLYKQMSAETGSLGEEDRQKQDVRGSEKLRQVVGGSGKQKGADGHAEGSYIVGGSAFGWNFITFSSNAPVYYGITKEAFRTSQVKLWE